MKYKLIFAIVRIRGKGDEAAIKTTFRGKSDLVNYAGKVLASSGEKLPTENWTVEHIFNELEDRGPGIGSRSWFRLSRKEFRENPARQLPG